MAEEQANQNDKWCQRSETATLLALSIAQIHMTLTEGNNSVETLTGSFQDLAHFCMRVEELSKTGGDENALSEIKSVAGNMSEQINSAIVAFQFYDRLCQRLSHVAISLDELSELLKHEDKLHDNAGWGNLRDSIRSLYTMKAEHVMYDTIMEGSTVEEALQIFKESLDKQAHEDDGDIELF